MPIGNEFARDRATKGNPPVGEPSSIIIRTPNWLGDLLVGTAFIGAVLERFPAARVDLIVRAGFDHLPLPHRGEVLPFDKNRSSAGAFGRSLRGRGYSHFFVMPPSFSAAWMAWRSGAPYRLGTRGQFRGWLLSPALTPAATPRSVHLLREYLELLRPWEKPGASEKPEARLPAASLHLPPGWIEQQRPREAEGPPYVVIAPGAEYGAAKQWPIRHYAAAAAELHKAGWRVIVAGLEPDRPHGDAILAGLQGGVNLCGKTDLPSLAALLAGAELVLSNDSGAMHLAAALGRPQVALFGSTNPVWTGPVNPRARVVTRNESCSPCYKRTCPLGHLRCLEELQPGEVVAQALALLEGEGRQ